MTTTPLPLTVRDPDCGPQIESHAIGADIAAVVAAALKALAEPLRLRMLSFIATAPAGEACVCDLAALTDVSQPTVSHHLRVLRDVGVVASERRGTWVWYRITPGYKAAVTTLLDSFAPAALEASVTQEVLRGLDDVDPALDHLATELATTFPGVRFEVVQRVVRDSYTDLARSAKISAHLVPLTGRFARQRLADITRDHAGRPQVLFVCVANAGRSQLAAALVRHYAGDRVTVRSAGSTPAAEIHAGVREALVALGTAQDAFPKPLTDDAVRAADVVITMGCGDVCPVLPGKRYEDWLVGDPALASPAGVAAIRDELDTRVRDLLTDLLPDLTLPA
ncbi:metalloregulator ArsR/SmtB family transcription factor [Oerskovia turbata]|uniref:Metalloregulator ArsR/SmtB family transcription factor n=1 Tax=Oerskovia turbata TaxID=1713 RepID=A0A4Q1KI26_9CELL|nr:metalloregulator ArsR/SmtB family transcription factor [Oerskovia turbata]RXR21555.1 metalloregulator ArsR/SmtB family transcription factor [Oerskovia turbata]RXR29433.1 metalloregulator ArsR/SmtB family transcription factor [Oerskovia turbata]TGJ96955.1 ArsR family transcriptional regulator [Actinotalea fermentans ATCC 43279 = JCM 9966 = DSM 3133]